MELVTREPNLIESYNRVPNSIEAEKAVLGSVFINPNHLEEIIEIIKPQDFYKMIHKDIFKIMVDLYTKGELVDPIMVREELNKKKEINIESIEETIFSIIEDVSTSANVASYAKLIKEKSILRKLGEVGTQIVEMSVEGYEDVDSILDKAEGMIFKISETKETKEVVGLKDVILEEFERIESVYHNKGATTGISSGFTHFDEMTSGFHASDLSILAARPSMGKTAFALNLALNAALKEKKSVLIFSLEMSSSQLLQRLMSTEAKVPLQKIRNGFLTNEEFGKLGIAIGMLGEASINIADTPNISVLEIRAIARRAKATGKLDMILIDYLQLIKGSKKGSESRQQEISDISRSLKSIARELNVPIVALSQLSRAPEQRADRRPMLSDLRDSGAIEQDADLVIFLYRDDYYNEDSEDKGIAEVIIGKQRNGPVGSIKLRFFHEFTKFADYTTLIK